MSAHSPIRIRKSQTPSSQSRPFLFESEAIRLQRTVDVFTLKLERERRQDILLSEQIRICEEELKRRKERLGPQIITLTEEKKMHLKIAGLSHELHLLATQVADTQTYNRSVKQAIEGCRREQTIFRAVIATLSTEIAAISQEATVKNGEYLRVSTAGARCRASIDQLRSRSVNDRLRQVAKLQELSVSITQTIVKDDLSAKGSFFRSLEDNFKLQMRRTVETIDPIPVQQALIQKWKDVTPPQKLTRMIAALDQYVRHIRVLEEAFRSIEAATGMSDIREIVTTVIKTEEQHYNLYMHMNTVTAEVDASEDALFIVRRTTSLFRSSKISGEQQATLILTDLSTKLKEFQSSVSIRSRQLESIKSAFAQSFPVVQVGNMQKLSEMFDAHEFQDIRPSDYQRGKLSVATVLACLASVESSIIVLLAWQSYVANSSKSMFRSLGHISSKRFEVSPLSVKTDLASSFIEEDDQLEARLPLPLREDEIRSRVKLLLEQKPATPSAVKPVPEHRKGGKTAH